MTGRFAPVLLAVLLLLAGCSQLASAPNEQPENTTVAGTDVQSATPSPTTTNATANATTTPNTTAAANTTTETIQGQAPTSSTPTATETTTPTRTSTAAPTTTGTPSPTATPSLESHFVVIIGGSPDDKVTYDFSVTGTIERRGESYGAPINDDGVTRDPDIDIISPNGSSVSGRLGGGGDAYRITGEITDFEAASEGAVDVYVDGERIETDD
ncbi:MULTISPECIES: hypothetical protein [Halococcus]|nr:MULTISPECIES: hypothetical protein [Halococcus]